jgi:hypothetical protein
MKVKDEDEGEGGMPEDLAKKTMLLELWGRSSNSVEGEGKGRCSCRI